MSLWWRNQAKVRSGGGVHSGLDCSKQGVGEIMVSRDLEGASAIFAEASWCALR